MAVGDLPPIEFLRECFVYDPATGRFRWCTRPETHFASAEAAEAWNARYADAPAFAAPDDSGYCRAEVRFRGRRFRLTAGRVAFALCHDWAPSIVDHENGVRTDNRLINLRPASEAQNRWNSRQPKGRETPKGAYLNRSGRWDARAGFRGRKVYLGVFNTPEEAHAAYCAFLAPRQGVFFRPGEGSL